MPSTDIRDSHPPSGTGSRTPDISKAKHQAKKSTLQELLGIGKTLARVVGLYLLLGVLVTLVQFPFQVDEVTSNAVPPESAAYYAQIYQAPQTETAIATEAEASPDEYVGIARESIDSLGLVRTLSTFVKDYDLTKARVLDVGSGTGYLQDVVEDYVGLDISPTAARFYHKPFMEASATEMPIPDNEFDAAWTVFVLEHVPNPEQALSEMRRVVKDDGVLYLAPAWDCQAWFADGYSVRPFGELGLTGKLYKAGIPFLEYQPFKMLTTVLKRLTLRAARLGGGPSRLHYRLLEPNYEQYWMPDSDALNDIDRDETLTWFTSRGDECLNCDETNPLFDMAPLIIRVHK